MIEAVRSVWLVGLSGSGKSTTGPLVADRIGFDFVDLDAQIQRKTGETIPQIFRTGGEPRFRRLEAAATSEIATLAGVVVATGGGWMARSDVERVGEGRVRVWLRVSPEVAIHRLGDGVGSGRPLLDAPDPEAALTALYRARKPAYAEAELSVETDGRSPVEVAEEVVRRLEGC
ncbi:MAG: shikimate kinase [Gemmatimonadetes bacterium]|nr:shikimate kinase [Gemmatimonadota bacterium]